MEMQASKKKSTNIMKDEPKIEEIDEEDKTKFIDNKDLLPTATVSKKDDKTIITNPSNKPEIKPTNIKPHLEQQKLNINEKFTGMNTWNGAMTDKYAWSQTNSDVSISIKLPEGKNKAKQLSIDMKRK